MPDGRSSNFVRFGPFELDLAAGDLQRDGQRIRLPEQQFQILQMLLGRKGEMVSREEIRKRLWPNDTIVEFDRSINAAVMKLRTALGDSADAPRYIETVARRGYRLLVAVEPAAYIPPPPAEKVAGNSEKVADNSRIGRRVAHYRVLSLLGGGGMGLVYKAEDLKLNRPVALKFLPEELASDPVTIRRFQREAQTASSLNHSNICTIYQVEEHGAEPFIVMELLDGESLRDLIAKFAKSPGLSGAGLPLPQLLDIAIQISEGLHAAHSNGIIHRDVKPANIFVTARGQVKILDFGLAKVTLADEDDPSSLSSESLYDGSQPPPRRELPIDHALSRTGITMGTAAYMSPEQIRGEKLDARTDLFSFGMILYEMATGQRACGGDTAAAVQDSILHRPTPSARSLNPDLPVALEEIICKALERDRKLRYQSAIEMSVDLRSMLKAMEASMAAASDATAVPSVDSAPQVPSSQSKPSKGRWRLAAAIAGVALLLIAAGLLWRAHSWRFYRPEIKERQLTTNSTDNPIIGAAISGDGKYLVYGDNVGLHIRSLLTGEVRDVPPPEEYGDAHLYWSVHWFPDSTRFLAVSRTFGGRTTTWLASVVGGLLHKVGDDLEAWSVSPDGTQFAAAKNGAHEIWLMDSDGANPRKVLPANGRNRFRQVQWSPDGAQLIYLKTDLSTSSLEIEDLKSGSSHSLLSEPRLRNLFWLRDGRLLYVLIDPGLKGQTCNYWIAPIDVKSGAFAFRPRQLTHNTDLCIADISATADSRKLIFTKTTDETSVQVADVDAGGVRISPPKGLSLNEGVEYPNGWTADSREVVFTSNRDKKWGIYRQPLTGGPARPILTEQGALGPQFGFPRVTPDGAWLLIARATPGSAPATMDDLFRVPMAGGTPEFIVRDVYGTPHCASAAGFCTYAKKENDTLIFIAFGPQSVTGHEIGRYTMPRDGIYNWDLSPDGSRIAIHQRFTGNIQILTLKTKALQPVFVKRWNNLVSIDWSADGKGLFMCSIQPSTVLLHVDLQGNTQILWEPQSVNMTWAIPSPDGRHVALMLHPTSANLWMMENFD